MRPIDGGDGNLLAISDLHIGYPENRAIVERMHPETDRDWLLVAGDIGEIVDDIRWTLETLIGRFRKVVWVPGNHELWTHPKDPVQLRGVARYDHLVGLCREVGVATPEDPYPVWEGPGGPAVVAPLFLLYDYSFLPAGCADKDQGLAYAHETGVVCTDEYLLHPDPYPSREAWCRARVAETERLPPNSPTTCPSSPSTTTRWTATRRTSCATPSSPCGAAPPPPPTGTAGSASRPWSTDICTSRGPPGTRGCASKRSRWVTRENGAGVPDSRARCAAFCRWRSKPVMEELLPEWVVAVESHGDDGTEAAPLYPEEQALLTRAVAKRRREFATVRRCARRAMEKLGVP